MLKAIKGDHHIGRAASPLAAFWPGSSPRKQEQQQDTASSGDSLSSSPPAFYLGVIPTIRTISMTNAVVLGVLAALAALVALSGGSTLGLLAIGRLAAPANVRIERPLALHYEGGTATALAALNPGLDHIAESLDQMASGDTRSSSADIAALLDADGSSSKGALPPRLLSPGDRVSVSVQLALPPQAVHTLLQVTGELLTINGRPLARRSATWLAAPESTAHKLWRWIAWPLYLLCWGDDSTLLDLELLTNFQEQPNASAVLFRAHLSGRTPNEGAPSVYRAKVVVRRHLGWREQLLCALTPGPLLTLALAMAGGMMLGAGSAASLALGAAAYLVYRWGTSGDRPAAGEVAAREGAVAAAQASDAVSAAPGANKPELSWGELDHESEASADNQGLIEAMLGSNRSSMHSRGDAAAPEAIDTNATATYMAKAGAPHGPPESLTASTSLDERAGEAPAEVSGAHQPSGSVFREIEEAVRQRKGFALAH